jgi:hypothetical protein
MINHLTLFEIRELSILSCTCTSFISPKTLANFSTKPIIVRLTINEDVLKASVEAAGKQVAEIKKEKEKEKEKTNKTKASGTGRGASYNHRGGSGGGGHHCGHKHHHGYAGRGGNPYYHNNNNYYGRAGGYSPAPPYHHPYQRSNGPNAPEFGECRHGAGTACWGPPKAKDKTLE